MAPPGLAPGCHRSASSSSPHFSFNRRWRPSFFSCSPSLYAESSYRFRRCHCSKRLRISSRNFEPPQLARASQKKAQQLQKDENFVEVIAIGSRKDAVLDFCLNSPFQSNSLRFWNITVNDSVKVLLQQRLLSTDLSPITVEFEAFLKFPPKAVILVASAGYGSDHTPVIDIIRSVRSANGFAISIFLKPFSFEGQRRQDEVSYLVGALQEHTNFCVDVDTDMLLKEDLVTLDEALKTANNAVLMATNTVSVLTHDLHLKHLAILHGDTKELTALELFEVLQDYKKAKIGFGTGHNIRASMVQATYQCPFLNFPVKDLHGIVLCIVAYSYVNESMDPRAISDTFHQTTGYEGDVVISIIHEPVLEANLVVTTLVTLGSVRDGQQETHESSFFSRLAKRFPFVFNLLRKENPQPNGDQGKISIGRESVEDLYVAEAGEGQFGIALDTTNEGSYVNDGVETFDKRNTIGSHTLFNSGQSDLEVLETSFETFENFSEAPGETPAFQREPLNAWSFGPGYEVAQKWAKARAENVASTSTLDSVSIFHLPVGVRPSGELKDSVHMSSAEKRMEEDRDDDVKGLVTESSMSPWSGFTDASLGAVKDFYSVASTLIKGKDADVPKKQGVLSLRAASMLEAERDSPKKWNPIVEMQYRGGVYKGRCQGGLPEGKGGLVLRDGSIYEGMWRCGKRSGCGTFYFSNGDVLQGSWRDDLIHGKGWYYFQSGDRWFVNFWKGKPSGEGRFYSKSGEVLFGQFKDGWRHGRFTCIDVDGQRYVENWDDGVLVNREPQDSHT